MVKRELAAEAVLEAKTMTLARVGFQTLADRIQTESLEQDLLLMAQMEETKMHAEALAEALEAEEATAQLAEAVIPKEELVATEDLSAVAAVAVLITPLL
jgi:hypothetical protein